MQKAPNGAFHILAEREGFEPSVRYHRTLAFQASTLNHSAISPNFRFLCPRGYLPEPIIGGMSSHVPGAN